MSNKMGETYVRQNNTMIVMLNKDSPKQSSKQEIVFAAAPLKSFD